MRIASALLAIILAVCAPAAIHAAGPESLVLASNHVEIEIDAKTGRLLSVLNKDANLKKTCRDTAFVLYTGRGIIRSDECRVTGAVQGGRQKASFGFESNGLKMTLSYLIPDSSRSFVLKTLSVKNAGRKTVILDTVEMCRIAFSPAPAETHFHTAGIVSSSPWVSSDTPINLFVRDLGGGLFLGIENSYFAFQRSGLNLCLRYEPRWVLKPGETFVSDPAFIGVYKNEGVYCFKQTPRPAKDKPSATGPQEILDWGEIWAMQDFMSHALSNDHPGKGFIAVYNACGGMENLLNGRDKKDRTPEEQALVDHFAGKSAWTREIVHGAFQQTWIEPFRILIDHLAETGHIDMLQPGTLWLGNGGFWDPKATDLDEIAPDDVIKPNPYWLQTVEYARSKGIDVYGFECPVSGYFPKRTDMKVIGRDGKPNTWNCYANPEFVQWHLKALDRAITDYNIPWWQWDEGWADVGGGECYATNHGHAPGNVSYQVYRNILNTTSELKRRHPGIWLVGISAFQHHNPWILRSVDESVVWWDSWYARNYLFIPSGKTYIADFTPQSDDYEYELLRRISLADHLQVSYPIWRSDPAKRKVLQDFWRKWMTWADDNIKYLRTRRDLFCPPAPGGLEGSAHIVDGRGFLFLFNPGTDDKIGGVPLSHLIGLADAGCRIREIYPQSRDYGVYANGDELLAPVRPKQALILEVVSTKESRSPSPPVAPTGAEVQKAFLTLKDILPRLTTDDVWSAPVAAGEKQ
jgi:hypothetical protein